MNDDNEIVVPAKEIWRVTKITPSNDVMVTAKLYYTALNGRMKTITLEREIVPGMQEAKALAADIRGPNGGMEGCLRITATVEL